MSSVECSFTYRSDVLNIDVDCDVEVDSDGCTVIQSTQLSSTSTPLVLILLLFTGVTIWMLAVGVVGCWVLSFLL